MPEFIELDNIVKSIDNSGDIVNDMFSKLMSDNHYSMDELTEFTKTIYEMIDKLEEDLKIVTTKVPALLLSQKIAGIKIVSYLISLIAVFLVLLNPIIGISVLALNLIFSIRTLIKVLNAKQSLKDIEKIDGMLDKISTHLKTLTSCKNKIMMRVAKHIETTKDKTPDNIILGYVDNIIDSYVESNVLFPIPEVVEPTLRMTLQSRYGANEEMDISKLLKIAKNNNVKQESNKALVRVREQKK